MAEEKNTLISAPNAPQPDPIRQALEQYKKDMTKPADAVQKLTRIDLVKSSSSVNTPDASAPAIQPPKTKQDRAGDALKILTADVTKSSDAVQLLTKHEELEALANSLQPELANKRLNMTKEQLERLTFDANLQALALRSQTIEEIVAASKEEDKDSKKTEGLHRLDAEQSVDGNISSLEQRYKTLEQYADRRPDWVRKTEGTATKAWQEFRKLPGVGDTLDWIGGMTGRTLNSAGDLWAWVKGAVLSSVANGDFTKNKKVMDWANMKLNEEAVAEGIQFAVNKAKKGQTITKMQGDKKEGVPLKVKFEPKFSADDIRAWEGVLTIGNWGKLTPAVATEYVDAYIRKYANQYKDKEMPLSVDALVKEGLTKNQPIAGPQAVPEVQFSGIPNLKLKVNQRSQLEGPTPEFDLNDGKATKVILDKNTITLNKDKFSVKKDMGAISATLEPKSANTGELLVYWDGATPLRLDYLVAQLTNTPPNLTIGGFSFDKIPTT